MTLIRMCFTGECVFLRDYAPSPNKVNPAYETPKEQEEGSLKDNKRDDNRIIDLLA